MPAMSAVSVLPTVTTEAMKSELRMNMPRRALVQAASMLARNSVPGTRLGLMTAELCCVALIRAKSTGSMIRKHATTSSTCVSHLPRRTSGSPVVHAPAAVAELEHGHDDHQEEQHYALGGGEAQVGRPSETVLVDLVDQGGGHARVIEGRGADRAAPGEDIDEPEGVEEGVHQVGEDEEEGHGREHGERDGEEALPGGGAVYLGRLRQLGRHVLQCG